MKKRKQFSILVLALLLCLGMAACGNENADSDQEIAGDDWRTTGVVRDNGIITRGGEETDVLVCVQESEASFYYDEKEQRLYDFVEYPFALSGDPWEQFQSIDFLDRNDDGDSDVAMIFTIEDETVLLVWFWDAEADAYVFQPEESSVPLIGQE